MTPQELQDEAREILLRAEFQDPERSIAGRVLDWIGERVANFFDATIGGLFAGDTSSAAMVLLAVVAIVLGYVIFKSLGRRTVTGRAAERKLEADISARRNAQDWLRLAKASEQAGDFESAVRCYYRAATAQLIDSGHIEDAPGVTARQVERQAELPGGVERDALADMTGVFEDVWYGGSPADADTARRIAADAAKVGV